MRDILFRGMKEDGKWVEGGYCNGYEQVEQVLDFVDGCRQCLHHYIAVGTIVNRGLSNRMLLYDVLPDTIGQYTGLCDKNGAKIFEGDIVQRNKKESFEIKWDRGGFCLSVKNSYTESGELFLPLIRIEEMEVIGNVFENQELLEKFSYEKARNDFLSECLNRRVGDDKRDN